MAAPAYLLDTNILVHFVRGSEVWARVRDRYQPFTTDPRPLISVVTVGEIRSLAIQWNWGRQKLDQMEFVLASFEVRTILNPDLIQAYASLDAFCEEIGKPLGKNDLWIAATAAYTRTTLLTTDRDFDRFSPQFLTRDWIDPDTQSSKS